MPEDWVEDWSMPVRHPNTQPPTRRAGESPPGEISRRAIPSSISTHNEEIPVSYQPSCLEQSHRDQGSADERSPRHRCKDTAQRLHRHHGRIRLRQEFPHQGNPLSCPPPPSGPSGRCPWRIQFAGRRRGRPSDHVEFVDRNPLSARVPQQPCHLSEGIRCHPCPLCQPATRLADQIHPITLLLQYWRRKMRGI